MISEIFKKNDYVAVHENAVWRDKANFIVLAYVGKNNDRNEWEQLWVRKIDQWRFSLCCIPFFVYDLALGDEVETNESYVVQNVTNPSGQFTFRIWFGDSTHIGIKEIVSKELKIMGALMEWSSVNLLATSTQDSIKAQQVADYLYTQQIAGYLTYETGKS